MSRTVGVIFQMVYVIEFTCAICGHYVYKSVWNPVKNGALFCHFVNFVGHILIELLYLIDHFLGNTEVSLVVPAKFSTFIKDLKIA